MLQLLFKSKCLIPASLPSDTLIMQTEVSLAELQQKWENIVKTAPIARLIINNYSGL